jgi:hypothetical protein
MPESAQFTGSHLPRVASDRSPVRSRLNAERDLSFAPHEPPPVGQELALGPWPDSGSSANARLPSLERSSERATGWPLSGTAS